MSGWVAVRNGDRGREDMGMEGTYVRKEGNGRNAYVLEGHDVLMSGAAIVELGFDLHVNGLLLGRDQGG